MSYYSLLEYWPGDCINSHVLKHKLKEIGIVEETLWDLIYKKLDPLIEKIKTEYQTTEEYKTKEKHNQILLQYHAAKTKFEETYGSGEYIYCYDIFGTLRNKEYLNKLIDKKKAQEEYTKRSYRSNQHSNYNDYFKSSYSIGNQSNYTEDEKEMLKKIYRTASKKFHPDISNDDGSMMKFLTKLKEQWGI